MDERSDPGSAAGAVLVGGSSRRMGTDKARLVIDGRPMALRCVDALRDAGLSPVMTVGGSTGTIAGDHVPDLPDRWPGQGPLGALITAIEGADTEVVVVLSCDLLDPSAGAIEELRRTLGPHDVAVPVVEGREQWLHAVWHHRVLDSLLDRFTDGERSIRAAVVDLDVVRLEIDDPTPYRDADRPSDLPTRSGGPHHDPTLSSAHPTGDSMPIPQIGVDELATAIAKGAPLYDVREPDEYRTAHVGGAVAVPLGEIVDSLELFADDRAVYVICASGGRSGKAVEYLRANAIDARNVAGGTNAWIKAGKDIVSGESPT